MGNCAALIGFGPFKKSIQDCLPYHSEFYQNVPDETKVLAIVFLCETSEQSDHLAMSCGLVTNDFATHAIDPNKTNYEDLEELFAAPLIEEFKRLLAAGFTFIFSPDN